MKYAFMKAELVAWFPIAVICRVLAVTQARYHAWLKRPASPSAIERDALADLVKGVFTAFKGKYGAPRLFRELCKHHGYTGSFTRVQKLMRTLGLKAKAGRKYKATTDSKHSLPTVTRAPNLLAQDFKSTATAPDQVWLSDITYLWTKEGWRVWVNARLLHARFVHPRDHRPLR